MYPLLVAIVEPYTLLHLLTAAGLVVFWWNRVLPRRQLVLVAAPFALLIIISMPAFAHFALGLVEGPSAPLAESSEDAQAIVVLGGSLRSPRETLGEAELGEMTLYRCLHVVHLDRQGLHLPIVVSGGKVDPTTPGPTLAEAMREFLVVQGIAEDRIVLEDESQTTYENAVNTARLLTHRGITRIVLVTNATHMLRSRRCFLAQGLAVVPASCYCRSPGFCWEVTEFLPNPNAAGRTCAAMHEGLGIAWYWLRGRI